jgi:hypothetical protein
MRVVWLIIGIIAVLVGILWILQGLNVLRGSGMSGHAVFTVIGVAVGVIGLALIGFGVQRRRVPSA